MTVYLDTSSLVKLYVAEPGSDDVREVVGQATVVSTSLLAYAETRAALARLRREGALTAATFSLAKRQFENEWPAYFAVEVTDSLWRAAGEMAERYGLRGFDSVHLASFAEVARGSGVGTTRFSSFDDRLNDAARKLTRTLARARH
jgi:predicted nucleic acid-binding protein